MTARHPIPDRALDDRLAIVGTSGSGKTYAAKGCVERILDKKHRVVIVDPLDVWWGLRLGVNGKSEGYPVRILGGRHGDMALTENSGGLIGEAIATTTESCIVSPRSLKNSTARHRFMLAFLDALYERTNPDKHEPYHVVFDEADLWAPQKPMGVEAMLCHLMEEIVRRGRVQGFIPWLITQRPAVLNKNVLSQADGLVAMSLTSSQDRDAIGAWIEGQADKQQGKEILASLPTLTQGEGVVWIPRQDILKTERFPENRTFDSSRTPKRGEKKRDVALKPLNLDAMKDRLGKVEAETKANDPATLKGEINKLKAELAKKPATTTQTVERVVTQSDPKEIKAAERRGYIEGYVQGNNRAHSIVTHLKTGANTIKLAIESNAELLKRFGNEFSGDPLKRAIKYFEASEEIKKHQSGSAAVVPTVHTPDVARSPLNSAPRVPPPSPAPSGDGTLSSTQRETLGALAWWASVGHDQPTRKQLGAMIGVVPTSSTMRSRLAALIAPGFIEYPNTETVRLTDAGAAAAPRPPTFGSIVEAIRANLNGSALATFDAIPADGSAISREELGRIIDVDYLSSTMRSRLAPLTAREVIDYPNRSDVRRQSWVTA